MKSLALDSTGDLKFKGNDLFFVTGEDELMQTIKTLLKTNLKEWFLNPEQGLDYAVIFTKSADEEVITFAIQEAMNQLDEIERIDDINIDFSSEKRHLEVKLTAYTVDGTELEVEEVF